MLERYPAHGARSEFSPQWLGSGRTRREVTVKIGEALWFPFTDRRYAGPLLVLVVVSLAAAVPDFFGTSANRPWDFLLGLAFGSVISAGYSMRIIRHVATGSPTDERRLPPWTNVGGLIGDGLGNIAISFAWFILSVLALALVVLLPVVVVGGLIGRPIDLVPSVQWFTEPSGGRFDTPWLLRLVGLLVPAVTGFFLAPALARTAVSQRSREGLRVPTILGTLRRNLSTYLLVVGVIAAFELARQGIAVSLRLTGVGELNLAAGIINTIITVVSGTFTSHLSGQAYRRARSPAETIHRLPRQSAPSPI